MSVAGTPISIADVLSDSPLFNAQLKVATDQLGPTKAALDQLTHDIAAYHRTGVAHHQAAARMTSSLRAASNYFVIDGISESLDGSPSDEPIAELANILDRANEYHRMLLSQVEGMLYVQTQRLASDIGAVIAAHSKLRDYNALRHSSMSKFCQSSPGMVSVDGADEEYCRRGEKAFGTRRVYQEFACDLVLELNRLETSARYSYVRAATDQLSAYHGYFKQATAAFEDVSVYTENLFDVIRDADSAAAAIMSEQRSRRALTVSEIQRAYSLDMKGLPELRRASTTQLNEDKGFGAAMKRLRQKAKDTVSDLSEKKTTMKSAPAPDKTIDLDAAIKALARSGTKQGWLLKRSTKSLIPSWKPEYFAIHGGHLVSLDEEGESHTVCDLQLTNVKTVQSAVVDRLHCLQISTPTSKLIIQTQGPRDVQEWRLSIENEISRTIHGTSHEGVPDGSLAHISGNDRCADCFSLDVSWASVNLGILLCIRCSGAHRSLGVDISKVRSTKLDSWTPEMVEHMKTIGNAKANAFYEARLHEFPADSRPGADASQETLYNWASAKYIEKKYVAKKNVEESGNRLLSHHTSMVSVGLDDPISPSLADEREFDSLLDDQDVLASTLSIDVVTPQSPSETTPLPEHA